MKQIFPGIFREGNNLYTVNLVPGSSVYGEKLLKKDREYREWVPERSKLAAAILNELKEVPIDEKSKILYLGASTGTTVSHCSDIAKHGVIYAIEFSERVFRSLIELSKKRGNIVPILADARKPEDYYWVEEVDVIYVDIADPQETEIAIRNANEFLKKNGYLLIAVKSQSIDVTKNPKQVYEEEKGKLEKSGFAVLQLVDLEPYEEKHCFILAKK
jgi:fibrillarin-like pre-rRNA processing protein